MNRIISPLLFVFVTTASVAGLQITSAYAGCWESADITSSEVTISPDLDCLDIKVDGHGCTGDVNFYVINECESDVVLIQTSPNCLGYTETGDWEPENCLPRTILSGESTYFAPNFKRGEKSDSKTFVLEATLDDELYTVNVAFEAEYKSSGVGCSTAPLQKPFSGSGALLLMALTFAGLGVRVRRRIEPTD